MMMIGDGVLAALSPRSHVNLWKRGPARWERLMGTFAEHATLTRVIGGAEAAIGIALARRQQAF